MSDRAKKLEEELQLRLLAVTEDPIFQGSHTGCEWVLGSMVILRKDDQGSAEASSTSKDYLH